MSNDAIDFLTQAKALQGNAANEMEHRTATNRAYYSVFHNALHIKKRLTLPDATRQLGGSHARLYCSLEECLPRHSTQHFDVRRFGIMAKRVLKPYRVNADYDIHILFPKSIMVELNEKAELLMAKTNSIVSMHERSAISSITNNP